MSSKQKYTPGKFGQAAILAVEEYKSPAPKKSWKQAVVEVFPDSPSSRDKGCPRNAMLGLCEEGFVRGVARGTYTKSLKNKHYALKAVELLRRDKTLANNADDLWAAVLKALQIKSKKHNQQMDVVLSLWHAGLLNTGNGS